VRYLKVETLKGTTSVLIPSLINIAEEMKRVLEKDERVGHGDIGGDLKHGSIRIKRHMHYQHLWIF
jgi:hypothetical protein